MLLFLDTVCTLGGVPLKVDADLVDISYSGCSHLQQKPLALRLKPSYRPLVSAIQRLGGSALIALSFASTLDDRMCSNGQARPCAALPPLRQVSEVPWRATRSCAFYHGPTRP